MRCTAALQVWSSEQTASDFARRLGVQATESHERGEVLGRSRRRTRVSEVSSWQLATDYREPSELAPLLEEILAVMEPKVELFHELLGQGYSARWWCYVEATGLERAIELPVDLLTRLAVLGADLLIDTYPAVEEDDSPADT